MLIQCGNTLVAPDWHVEENEGTGYFRIYYVHDGGAVYKGNDREQMLVPGHVYILPNCIPYELKQIREPGFECTYMHVDLPAVQISGMIELVPTQEDSLYFYMHLVRRLIEERQKDLLQNLMELIVHYCKGSEYFTLSSEFLYTISKYIQEHIAEKITVEELSDLYHYNPNYFIEVFKKEANCTPHQYILRARMQKAVALLRRRENIKVVAEAVGYADISSFCRVFKRYYGVTPTRYVDSSKAHP